MLETDSDEVMTQCIYIYMYIYIYVYIYIYICICMYTQTWNLNKNDLLWILCDLYGGCYAFTLSVIK